MPRSINLLVLFAVASAEASEPSRVSLVGSGKVNVTVIAIHASSTPLLPAGPLGLVASPSPCALPRRAALPDGSGGPFALLLERGGCSFDVKMGLAIAAGASVLIVADTLTYRATPPGANASSGAEADSTSPPWMVLSDPCSVDCAGGSVSLDATALSRRDVLSGLEAQCALACGGLPCGFADPVPPNPPPSDGTPSLAWVGRRLGLDTPPPPVWPVRRACCGVDEAIDMRISRSVPLPISVTMPISVPVPLSARAPLSGAHPAGQEWEVLQAGHAVGGSAAALPALFLPLSSAMRLLAAAGPAAYGPPSGTTPAPPRLVLRPGLADNTGGGSRPGWDGSSWGILFLGTAIAALASATGARAQAAAAAGGAGGGGEAETLQMSAGMALGFLGMASALLLGLYVLLQARHKPPAPFSPMPPFRHCSFLFLFHFF